MAQTQYDKGLESFSKAVWRAGKKLQYSKSSLALFKAAFVMLPFSGNSVRTENNASTDSKTEAQSIVLDDGTKIFISGSDSTKSYSGGEVTQNIDGMLLVISRPDGTRCEIDWNKFKSSGGLYETRYNLLSCAENGRRLSEDESYEMMDRIGLHSILAETASKLAAGACRNAFRRGTKA